MIRNQDLAQEIGKKRGKARVDVYVGEIEQKRSCCREASLGKKKVDVGEIDQKSCYAGIEP